MKERRRRRGKVAQLSFHRGPLLFSFQLIICLMFDSVVVLFLLISCFHHDSVIQYIYNPRSDGNHDSFWVGFTMFLILIQAMNYDLSLLCIYMIQYMWSHLKFGLPLFTYVSDQHMYWTIFLFGRNCNYMCVKLHSTHRFIASLWAYIYICSRRHWGLFYICSGPCMMMFLNPNMALITSVWIIYVCLLLFRINICIGRYFCLALIVITCVLNFIQPWLHCINLSLYICSPMLMRFTCILYLFWPIYLSDDVFKSWYGSDYLCLDHIYTYMLS